MAFLLSYKESRTSMVDTVSLEYVWLNKKHSSKMKFDLTFYTSFSELSKHLEFLSFQIVHQIQAGKILRLFLSLACEQVPSQLLRA